MSAARDPLNRVLVAGSGQVGVIAAIGLKRAMPGCEVIVLDMPMGPVDFADIAATALPATGRLHAKLRIAEEAIVRGASGSHRLVMRYFGWGGPGQTGAQPYGASGHASQAARFAEQWGGGTRAETGAAPSAIGEVLANAGRFRIPSASPDDPLAPVEYALRWDPRAYRGLLIAEAQKLGVVYMQGAIERVATGAQGIAAVQVAGQGDISADLFVDCSGSAARLLSTVTDHAVESWSDVLPDRRILIAPSGQPMAALEDRITLNTLGWVTEFAGRTGLQVVMGAAPSASDTEIRDLLGAAPIYDRSVRAGRAAQPWLGNVVALGDAAARFEPLGFFNLDLAHRMLALLLELLPGRDIAVGERAEFNRRSAMMMDGVRDVLALHYAAPAAAQVFGAPDVPAAVATTIDQFTRRGRLPHHEEAPLLGNEQVALMIALGFARGTPPQERHDDTFEAERAAQSLNQQTQAALSQTPPYAQWLNEVAAPGARP